MKRRQVPNSGVSLLYTKKQVFFIKTQLTPLKTCFGLLYCIFVEVHRDCQALQVFLSKFRKTLTGQLQDSRTEIVF